MKEWKKVKGINTKNMEVGGEGLQIYGKERLEMLKVEIALYRNAYAQDYQ